MSCRIIFVGGVHGVGKTEFSRKVTQELDLIHLTASNLIREAGQLIETGIKQVSSASRNQDALVEALQKYQSIHKPIILDGHFCLLDSHTNIQEISISTFQQIAPQAVIVLIDEPNAIAGRLAARDGTLMNAHFISKFQKHELDHAQKVCHALDIPFATHRPDQSIGMVFEFLNKHL